MLNQLKKSLISEKKDLAVFDIVLYGSYAKGDVLARDVDIAVIFLEGSLRERLDKVQGIKQKLKNLNLQLDVKQMLLKDLFSSNFLARTGILIEGISLLQGKKFSEILGFSTASLFFYSLKSLNHTEKIKFNYILSGRNATGLLEILGGRRLANAAISIPMEKSNEFEKFLKDRKIEYNRLDILQAI